MTINQECNYWSCLFDTAKRIASFPLDVARNFREFHEAALTLISPLLWLLIVVSFPISIPLLALSQCLAARRYRAKYFPTDDP